MRKVGGGNSGQLPDDQRLVVISQCSSDRLSRTNCIAVGEYHDQAAKRRITIRTEDAVLTSRRLAQGKKRFAFGTKPLCKFGGQRQISGYLAGPKVHDDLVHVFHGEVAQALVQRLKVSGV